MQFWELVLIAMSLGTDAFSVGVTVGSRGAGFRQYFRASFHFGLFQFFMPLLGWFASSQVIGFVAEYNRYLAGFILTLISINMLKEAFSLSDEIDPSRDITRGWKLVALSFATSIDAFGVGFSIGFISKSLLVPCIIIGVVALLMTIVGIRLGDQLAGKIGKQAEILGALVLLGIAIKFVFFS